MALFGALLLAAMAGCESSEPGAASALVGGSDPVDAAANALIAAEQARADSVQEWKTRFGNRVQRPDSVRALYVNGWAAGSRSRMAELIRIADETEINAFVIDIKESDTYLTYDSTGIELARQIGADQRPASKWLPALIDTLQAHNIYPIARIVVFKDRMLAEQRPDLAIMHVEGGIWKDQRDKPWVDPYNRTVWDYNIDIAREALDMGFSEIQWDYVRFPDVVNSLQRTMAFPSAAGVSRADNIRNFIVYSREQLADYEVPITADVFGLATHTEGDVGIGQQWEKLITVADALLPMVYPSHYYAGMYGFSQPNARPYEIVRISMEDAVRRTRYLADAGETVGEIVPWLEAMTATWIKPTVEYDSLHLRDQIQAVYDTGLKSWTLWNPGSRYDIFLDALRTKDGQLSAVELNGWQRPEWTPPESRLSVVVRRHEAELAAQLAAAEAAAAAADSLANATELEI